MEHSPAPSSTTSPAESVTTGQSSNFRQTMSPLLDLGNAQETVAPSLDKTGSSSTNPESKQVELSIKKAYANFLREEKEYMATGDWDKFPQGSRIHIVKVPYSQATKWEIYKKFSKFGQLAQIALRITYGFVQFQTPGEAQDALVALQGTKLLGETLSLEISKPQRKKGRSHPLPTAKPRSLPRPKSSEQHPDVLLLMLEKVTPEFVTWVKSSFDARGLNTEVVGIISDPGAVTERAVFDGARAVVGLDQLAEKRGLIRMTVYQKITESQNLARFSDYGDLYPGWAAQLIKQDTYEFLTPAPASPIQPPNEYEELPQVIQPADSEDAYDPAANFGIRK